MDFLPIFMNVKDRLCLIIGGGEVAQRKASVLLDAGAMVKAVAPEFLEEFSGLAGIEYVVQRFQPNHLDGAILVIAATDDHVVNHEVSKLARARNIPVNVVDNPDLCTFIMPSILDRSPLMVAFSSGGASPVLARMLRGKLETMIPQGYSRLTAFCARLRNTVRTGITEPAIRRIFWENVLEGTIAEKVLAGDEADAEAMLLDQLKKGNKPPSGEVYLVGAGPGDPDLLTFRALRLMQKADIVLFDNLVSKPIVEMTRRDATRIYVGKQRNNHTLPQEEINVLLVRLAQEGKRVLRLKGGDPFIFGRGGEEIETLAAHGIPFQIVPGITAASGVASYAGIPLTHRDYAQSCTFVTGHLKNGTTNLDWERLARPNQTIVFYMGLHGLETICAQLVSHGLPAGTPAALVQQGTTQDQRIYTGTLATLPEIVQTEKPRPPTLIIVGGVVTLREKLNWFHPEKSE
ncbi:siroheme synthase CysG [Nitrosomonas mobilis]|uniref:Siroheme synthase n=1 Tax=Nitrosomonas mobilis TaxID=51642 RepID=A0A1G5SFZ2_9PROT|nr:siroheme synthase CysG [Nitrosomonas mobilis]SCZ85461.1 fused siroheme synthase 1,3-dimethyluroporphyriongen III dehydrogenase and siroheme ferrochelatase; uroporphyrinogen methyltransferase [Nitrosomonas mobilis]